MKLSLVSDTRESVEVALAVLCAPVVHEPCRVCEGGEGAPCSPECEALASWHRAVGCADAAQALVEFAFKSNYRLFGDSRLRPVLEHAANLIAESLASLTRAELALTEASEG